MSNVYEGVSRVFVKHGGASGEPRRRLTLSVPNLPADEFSLAVQAIAAAVACIGFAPYRFDAGEDCFAIDFFPTYQMDSANFRLEITCAGRYEWFGERFDSLFNALMRMRLEAEKWAVGEFDGFEKT